MDADNSELMTFNFQFFVKELEYNNDDKNESRCVPAVGVTLLGFPPAIIHPRGDIGDHDRSTPYLNRHDSQRRFRYGKSCKFVMKRAALVDELSGSSAPIRICLIDSDHPTLQLAAYGLLNDHKLAQKVSELVVPANTALNTKMAVMAKKYLVPLFTSSKSTCGFVILSIKVSATCVSNITSPPVTSEPLQNLGKGKMVECSSSFGFVPEPSHHIMEAGEDTGQATPTSLECPIHPLVPPPPPLYFTSRSYSRQEVRQEGDTILKQTLVQCWNELLASKGDHIQLSSTPPHRIHVPLKGEEKRFFDAGAVPNKQHDCSTLPDPGPIGNSTHFNVSGCPVLSALYNELSTLRTLHTGTQPGTTSTGTSPCDRDTRTQATQTIADWPSSPTTCTDEPRYDTNVSSTASDGGKDKRKFIRTCCQLNAEHQPVKLRDVNADFRAVIKKVKKRRSHSKKAHQSVAADRVASKPPIDRRAVKKVQTSPERSKHMTCDKENQDKTSPSKSLGEESSGSDSEHQKSDTGPMDSHSTYDINDMRVPNNSCTSLLIHPRAKHSLSILPSAASTGSFEGTSLDNTQGTSFDDTQGTFLDDTTTSLDNTRGSFLDRGVLGQKIYLASSLQSSQATIDSDSDHKDTISASCDNDTSYFKLLPKGLSSLSVSGSDSSSHRQSPPVTTPSDASSLHHDDDAIKDSNTSDIIEEQIDDSYSDDFEDESP